MFSKNFLCKISRTFLKVKSIILLFHYYVKRIHISLLLHFILQLGQTSKAFEHLGNALTYDPSNVKVRFWHSLRPLCTMYVELIFLLAQSSKLNIPQESMNSKMLYVYVLMEKVKLICNGEGNIVS